MLRTYEKGVAIVTGGASGIGKALARELARRGAEVVIGDLQAPQGDAVAREITGAGGRATAVPLDVRDRNAVFTFIESVKKKHGRIDYVFNNAGTGVFGEAHLQSASDWDLQLDVNVRGVAHVVQAAYPILREQGFGHLVNTASVAGLVGSPFVSVYCATKHAVVGLSKALRVEAADRGVRVSALCPGAVRTPLLTGGVIGRSVYGMTPERALEWWARMRPVDVDVFARDTLDAVSRNEAVIVLPKQSRVMVALARLLPGFEEKLARKLYAVTMRDFPEIRAGAAPKEKANGTHGVAAAPN